METLLGCMVAFKDAVGSDCKNLQEIQPREDDGDDTNAPKENFNQSIQVTRIRV
jgi:hypothetical protein